MWLTIYLPGYTVPYHRTLQYYELGGGLYVMLLVVQNVSTWLWWFIYYLVKFSEILLYLLIKALCVCGSLVIHTAVWG